MHTLLSLLFNFQDTIEKTLSSFSLMGTSGLEPPTSRLSGVRSNHLSYAPIQNRSVRFNYWCFSSYPSYPFGGDEEDRTPDPLLAKQVLSQLSYTPMCAKWCSSATSIHPPDKVGIQVSLCLCQDTNRPNKFDRSRLCFA